MSRRRWILILLVIVAVVAAGWWFLSRPEPPAPSVGREPESPERFALDEFEIVSPELQVTPATVRWATNPDHTSWLVMTSCIEAGGCAGRFTLKIRYSSGGERRSVSLTEDFNVSSGQEMRFEGIENRRSEIDHLEDLSLDVVFRGAPEETVEIEL